MSNRRRYASLALLAVTLSLTYGLWYSYSVIMVALLREFGWSRSVLAGAFSLFTLAHGFCNPLVSWLCGRVPPPRVVAAGGIGLGIALWLNSYIDTPLDLYLGFGVATALAVSACGWVPALIQTQRLFSDRLGLALGIVSSGVGFGMLLVVPLFQLLIDAFGWRSAFQALAAICVVWIVPSAIYLLRSGAPVVTTRAATGAALSRDVQSRDAVPGAPPSLAASLRSAPFWLIMGTFVFGNICSQTLHVHQVAYLVDHGVAAIVAASVVGVVGAASIVAKIGTGWISDMLDRELVFASCMVIMMAAVGALVAVGSSPSAWGAYGYAVLLGVGYSVTASLIPAMMSDRFSGPHFATIMGVGMLGSAAGSSFGPWLAGWLFDVSGSYALPLAIAAGCGLLAGAAALGLWWLRKHGAPRRTG